MSEANIRIVSEDGIGQGTTVSSLKDGREFPGLASIRIGEIIPGQPIVAEMTIILVNLDLTAVGRFVVTDPVTLEHKAIAKIVYADGTEFVPPTAVPGS